MPRQTTPFARFEWMIAWRYLRARRAEGGVSVMTWISLIGITLAVFALIATLSVRSGFRAEFVDTILGANAHVTIYAESTNPNSTGRTGPIADYEALARQDRDRPRRYPRRTADQRAGAWPTRASAMRACRCLASDQRPRHHPASQTRTPHGAIIARFPEGIALWSGVARELGAASATGSN